MRSIILAALLLASGDASAANLCHGADGAWNFGGLGFGEDASKLVAGDCSGYCAAKGPDGINYVVSNGTGDGKAHIVKKSRALLPNEALPFGVVAADKPDDVIAKIKASGGSGGYARSASGIKGAGVICNADHGTTYEFLFTYDRNGHMTGLSQTPEIDGGLYTDDVTESFGPPGYRE
ncbi:MAG TPA: hypothetical protein VGG48_14890 [Rhizomicrobium sp.]|jgi:hypothetical protein